MPGPCADALASLITLDALDQELLALRAEAARVPAELAARQTEIGEASKARDALTETLGAKRSAQREAERELEDVERRTERAHKRMENLFTNEQIAATQREIAQLGDRQDALEGTILELMEEVDDLEGRESSANEAIDGAQASLDADSAAWEARNGVVTARIAALEGEVAALKPTIDGEAMKAYVIGFENRRNRHHRGVTWTEGIMCTQCRTEAPARWVNEAMNGDGIHRCLGCKRVLVGAAPVDDEAEEE